eukprot:jgi/Tetstr1/466762/TSEL_011232.t1
MTPVEKKSKKTKKIKAAAAEADGAAEAEHMPPDQANGSTGKLEKKAKKKKKKREGEVAEARGLAGATEGKKKKRKTDKQGKTQGEDEAAVPPPKKVKKVQAATSLSDMASVGDRTLAQVAKPLVKNLYKEHPKVAQMSAQEVAAVRQKFDMTVEGCDMAPIMDFAHVGLPPALMACTSGFKEPSAIQAQSWPVVLSGRDLVGIASTGSGKTLAFGVPGMAHIQARLAEGLQCGKGRPIMLAIAPTRELACQIQEVLEDAGKACKIRSLCAYGGVPKSHQVSALKVGVEIVVATPGRLEDLVNDGSCKLSQVSFLVLDEADRMLDLGFEPHIRTIASGIRADRQTVMFSATWPQEVQRLAMDYMAAPARVTIGSEDLTANHSITQHVEVIEARDRGQRLEKILRKHHTGTERMLVFVLYKKEAPRVEEFLQSRSFKALAIHGDMGQRDRTRAVDEFKSGATPILIATDVAARGLDIPDVEVVINYSFPLTIEDYIHRIGRTGRAGKTGIAYTFFCGPQDKPRSGELINVLREANQKVPSELLKFGTTVKKKESKLYGAHFKDVDMNAKATKITFDSDSD